MYVNNNKCRAINLRPFLWWRYDFWRSLIDHFNSEINLTQSYEIKEVRTNSFSKTDSRFLYKLYPNQL